MLSEGMEGGLKVGLGRKYKPHALRGWWFVRHVVAARLLDFSVVSCNISNVPVCQCAVVGAELRKCHARVCCSKQTGLCSN
jgi:hypothetical protein